MGQKASDPEEATSRPFHCTAVARSVTMTRGLTRVTMTRVHTIDSKSEPSPAADKREGSKQKLGQGQC